MQRPPRMEDRTMQDLIEQMREMVPHYTPEWRFHPDDPDPGTALFFLFADMYMHNVERLNRVPEKNRVAFLNLLDVSPLSAKPAGAHVTFELSEGAQEAVFVPRGTQIAAAAPDGGENVPFETDAALLVTPAKLVSRWQASAKDDRIVRMEDGTEVLFDLRAGENQQAHELYLGHADLLLLKSGAQVEIELFHSEARYREQTYGEKLADSSRVEWLYGTADGWKPFDRVRAEGHRVVLEKRSLDEVVPLTVYGVENRWILCRVKPQQLDAVSRTGQELVIDGLRMKTDSWSGEGRGGLLPEHLFVNDVQAEAEGCFPFGELFAPYGMFYVGSEEVFSKAGSLVTLTFDLKCVPKRALEEEEKPIQWKLVMKQEDLERPKVPEAAVLKVHWEYWNGTGWMRLVTSKEAEELFYRPEEEAVERTLQFECPADFAETVVNGQFGLWVRARVHEVENLYANNPLYLTPYVERLRMTYRYVGQTSSVQACLTRNNMEWVERTRELTTAPQAFAPFTAWNGTAPALYLGFSRPPVKGPIQMYWALSQQGAATERPLLEWEYWRGKGEWAPLRTFDETQGLSRSGTVSFVGPGDFVPGRFFQEELYWVRVVNRSGTPLAKLDAIHLNTVKAVQQESVRGEFPSRVGRHEEIAFQLAKTPVHAEEVWVDETGLSEHDVEALEAADGSRLQVVRDSEGLLLRVWVRWQPVELLEESGPEDRHYVIQPGKGQLRFGDGKNGKMPPNRGVDKVRVEYKVIAGKRGNVGAGEIKQLLKSIAFINRVFNPEPAAGGCEAETVEQALRRGPQMIKHRDRAVTAEDYEWLARQAHPDLAKVKCLPGFNPQMEREPGALTVVVMGSEGVQAENLHAFARMKQDVESYLRARSASTVAEEGNVHVMAPAQVEVSLHVELVVNDPERVVPAESEALAQLSAFLDPVRGCHDGKGWEIGQQCHVSMFYGLLKKIPGVRQIRKLTMTAVQVENGVRTELSGEQAVRVPHGIVVGGSHHVFVDVG